MSAQVKSVEGRTVTLEVKVELQAMMLASEEAIQQAVNEAGCLATGEALKRFDTDGSKRVTGSVRWSSKGQLPKRYQTPYGEVEVRRHVYQTVDGGKTYCPLEQRARMVVTATPKLAQQVAHKLAQSSSPDVAEDFALNHGRPLARSYVQKLAQAVGSVAQATEEDWEYEPPELAVPIKTVAVGLDGSCLLLCEDGWREAMVGTVAMYDADGERQHTIYLGAAPEYGKARFLHRLEREIERAKQRYPAATYVGLADGADTNWRFLHQHTSVQILDFYHAAGYLSAVATAVYPKAPAHQRQWLDERCHRLKHEAGSAERLYAEMAALEPQQGLSKAGQDQLSAAVTYFTNHKHQMHYAQWREKHYPIGSGVTEAACKTLIKQRLCNSGMRWKEPGAAVILSLRALVLTKGRWQQFWDRIDQDGFPVAA